MPESNTQIPVDEMLASHKQAADACVACSLHKNRRQAVWADGDASCEIMLVGEAPGKDEDIEGIPFVGRAGELLNTILERVGIPRSIIYIANVIKCRPPENRTPTTSEMNTCKHFLFTQIQLVNPKLIVAMGNPACYVLMGRPSGITKFHGQEHYYGDIPIIPTFHTAYLLRNLGDHKLKNSAWQDWKKIKRMWEELRT
jgi:DNA polymerase